jgi:hypothetical protein
MDSLGDRHNVYVMAIGITNVVFLVLYIDDLLIFSKNVKDIVKKKFYGEFDMKDLGEVLYCLGMQITWNREEKTIKICLKKYIEYIFTRFGMENFKLVSMPLDSNTKFTKDETPMDL